MLDPHALGSAFQAAVELGFKIAIDALGPALTAQETQDLAAPKVLHPMAQEARVKSGQIFRSPKHEIGRGLAFLQTPIVLLPNGPAEIFYRRMALPQHPLEHLWPIGLELRRGQRLRFFHLLQMEEAVALLHKTNPRLLHLPGQPLPTIEAERVTHCRETKSGAADAESPYSACRK